MQASNKQTKAKLSTQKKEFVKLPRLSSWKVFLEWVKKYRIFLIKDAFTMHNSAFWRGLGFQM